MLKKILSFVLILAFSAFAGDVTSDLGVAMSEDDKYRIIVAITSLESAQKWIATGEALATKSKVELNQEVGLFLVVSPSSDIDVNLSYSVVLKMPDGQVSLPLDYVLAKGKLEKGIGHPMQGQMYTIVANAPSDCGTYQFIVDVFDNGKQFQRFIMSFDVVEAQKTKKLPSSRSTNRDL